MFTGAPFSPFKLARSASLPAESTWWNQVGCSRKEAAPSGEAADFNGFNGVLVTNALNVVKYKPMLSPNVRLFYKYGRYVRNKVFMSDISLLSLSAASPVPAQTGARPLRSCCALIGYSQKQAF